MELLDDNIILENIKELREILAAPKGKLVKGPISASDYFRDLSHVAPELKYPEIGISKTVINVCELISGILLECLDESNSKAIVMIFEYYFLVSPILFSGQGARMVNDILFMKHFMRYIKFLCASRTSTQKELGNILASLELDNPIEGKV